VDNKQPEELMAQVMSNPKYKNITPELVLRLSQEALAAGLAGKHAVKFVRNKLHQVGGAYFRKKIDYTSAAQALINLPEDVFSAATRDYCLEMMRMHASTAERLPILETFFQTCLASIAPVTSINDLACGLNPLAIPWMPLADQVHYHACDIYSDMLGLINAFFAHFNLSGRATPCDLVAGAPAEKTQVAFLLKSIPCLEQMDKSIVTRLLADIQSEHILVSFPVHSLRGQKKGMESFYRDRFITLIGEKTWGVQEFHFQTELAFLVSK
jgi:16S rRNA (guanine(1405)-N(7))-methyltransferase